MSNTRVRFRVISLCYVLLVSGGAYAADIEAGRLKSTQCAICHGDDGEGNGAPKSKISGMEVDKFIKHLQDFKAGARKNVMMERFARRLSDEDIENLAAYYATK
jgi:cytochrome c553